MWGWISVLVAIATFLFCVHVQCEGQYDWMGYDEFDIINKQYTFVNKKNCRAKNRDELVMRSDVVSQLPVYNTLKSQVWYKNRTALLHLHNMALNRAFFYSYVLQRMNDSASFTKQPNWMYYYFSAVADVNSNPYMINGSAVYFDIDCHYPNWYTTVPFNKTLKLFGPKVFRHDNYRDQGNWLREPNRQVVKAVDRGAGRTMNYTHEAFKMNPWYKTWLPDVVGDMDSLTKFTYHVGLRMSNVTGEFKTPEFISYAFFGPSSPGAMEKDPRVLPVQFTAPYFDCGGSNKWVVSAVSPIVDYMPRYSNYTHLRRQRIVALSVMDIYFNEIDFNACGVSKGNPGPSYLSGIHKCKKTTSCKHTSGYGFKKGGYKCVCKAGTHLPWWESPPFQGKDMEQATKREYDVGFKCLPTDYRLVLPVVDQLDGSLIEGGGSFFNSGGLPLATSREKRSLLANVSLDIGIVKDNSNLNKTEGHNSLKYQTDRGEQQSRGDYKHHKAKELLDQIRQGSVRSAGTEGQGHDLSMPEMKEIMDQERDWKAEEKNSTGPKFNLTSFKYVPRYFDDYQDRNNVDFEVEKSYEEDVDSHEQYIQDLIQEKRLNNLTLRESVLKNSVTRLRERHIQRYHGNLKRPMGASSRKKRAAVYDPHAFDRIMRLVRQKVSVSPRNCHKKANHLLRLPGDVGYGVKKQFEPEGRTALRLSHFLSLYLQHAMASENFGNLRGGGRLQEDQLYGEVLANVMGNFRIYSAGLYFDRYKFENDDGSVRELFGPWAFQKKGSYFGLDMAGLSSSYVDTEWFRQAKSRFASNFEGLKTYKTRSYVRSDPQGLNSVHHEFFPIEYKAAPYEAGFWTSPYFRCDGHVDAWVMTYVSPFFGLDSLRLRLEFRGVTTVDVPLNLLEINQCPQPFGVANAFKNTARCDYLSTKCAPQPGFNFVRGAYTCKCRLGFEYWHYDGKEWFEGSFVESEYEKKRLGYFSRFDHLYCRPASASTMSTSLIHLVVSLILTSIINH